MEKKKVLLLDDEQELTFILSTVLEFNQFQVTVTNKAEDAIQALQSTTFDLLISDYMMEGMNGMQVIDKVRGEFKLTEMKIILLTFKELDQEELKKISENNVVYLKKPFLPNELMQKVETLFA